MGANVSQFQDVISQMLSEEPMNTLLSEEIRNLSYEDFLRLLGELNLLSKEYLDSSGRQLVFAVKKDTDATIFWKATIQIACVKLHPGDHKIATIRILTLGEFLKVFKTLKCQSQAASHSSKDPPEMSISNVIDGVKFDTKDNGTECCICFERKQEITLPCAHSYCTHCIEEWNQTHNTCPICRERIESCNDNWIMSEVPNAEEISNEIRENLMELTNDRRNTCNTS